MCKGASSAVHGLAVQMSTGLPSERCALLIVMILKTWICWKLCNLISKSTCPESFSTKSISACRDQTWYHIMLGCVSMLNGKEFEITVNTWWNGLIMIMRTWNECLSACLTRCLGRPLDGNLVTLACLDNTEIFCFKSNSTVVEWTSVDFWFETKYFTIL